MIGTSLKCSRGRKKATVAETDYNLGVEVKARLERWAQARAQVWWDTAGIWVIFMVIIGIHKWVLWVI